MDRKIIPVLFLFWTVFFSGEKKQSTALPDWFLNEFKSRGLNYKYELDPFIKPGFLTADFNGDGNSDVGALIVEKKSGKKGILIIEGSSIKCSIFGAGINFGDAGAYFKWAGHWSVFTKNVAEQTIFDKNSGDILGNKKVKLFNPGILIQSYEDGSPNAGGIIYWNGSKYIWIHHGE